MAFGGAALRVGSTALRGIELLTSIIVLGIFSWYLADLSHHHIPIRQWLRAVEGISGAAVLYLCFAVFLTLCLGAVRFFAFIAVVLDICFVGCFVAVSYLTRGGAGNCKGYVNTPLGSGTPGQQTSSNNFGLGGKPNSDFTPNLHLACKMETAVFAVSILNVFLFIATAILQVLLARHHQNEKKFGRSPANNYTYGLGKAQFWKRNKNVNTRDAEMATAATTVPAATYDGAATRHSQDTGFTGSTMHGTAVNQPKFGQPGYGQEAAY